MGDRVAPADDATRWRYLCVSAPETVDSEESLSLPGGRSRVLFSFSNASSQTSGADQPPEKIEALQLGAPLMDWLLAQLAALGKPADARPRRQPESVHEITGRLFSAYTVDGGSVHLAGCSLDERPFVRLSYAAEAGQVAHLLVDADGQVVPQKQTDELGLDDVTPYGERPPRYDALAITALVDVARQRAVERLHVAATDAPLAVAVVWCKHAEGRLRFEIDGATADLPFAGWVRSLAPPPFVCPITGARGYCVAADDDGKITVADQIATCEISGRRMIAAELAACAATGKRVSAQYTTHCPILDQPVLTDHTETCKWCQQTVSETVVSGGVCRACREMQPVGKDDPRLARLFGEHPRLDAWRKWKLSETADCYVASASGLLRQLLIVADKETLEVRWLAQRSRLGGSWTAPPDAIRHELLR